MRQRNPIAAYQKAIELNPQNDRVYNSMGWVYLLQDDFTQASKSFDEAIRLAPDNYSPVLNLGLLYALQGNMDGANKQWKKGLELCKNDNDWQKLTRAFYTVAIGECEQGIFEMQAAIAAGASIAALQNVLKYAEVLAQGLPETLDETQHLEL